MARTLFNADFVAPRWLKNRQLQTLAPHFLWRKTPRCDTELLDLPDGDVLELGWSVPPTAKDNTPLLVILTEEESSLLRSPSTRALLTSAARKGWRAVVMHFRGCGKIQNRSSRGYHAGDTADAYWLMSVLARRFPQAPKVAVGFSVGGNVLLKLAAEQGGDGLDIAGAISVSAPLDLASHSDALNLGQARRHQQRILQRMRRRIERKREEKMLPLEISAKQLQRLDTLWAFDNEITAPLYGFSSATDYYRRASAGALLDRLELPTLILHAQDDPYVPGDIFMRLPLPSANVRIELARHGGHLGFVEQHKGLPHSWMIDRIMAQVERWVEMPELHVVYP